MSQNPRGELKKQGSAFTAGNDSPIIHGNHNTMATGKSTAIGSFHLPSFLEGMATGIVTSILAHIIIKMLF